MTMRDHPTALALASSRGDDASAASVRVHLERCHTCRVRAARLHRAGGMDEPSDASLRRILEASSSGPPVLRTLLARPAATGPRPGQIWRVGRGEALLVWVRRVMKDAVDVFPVVLDVELADPLSVVLPSTATPWGTELALMTGVRARLHRRAFLQHVGDLDVTVQVEEATAAAREGRAARGVTVGPPIWAEDDQRIEYQRVLADLLADLGPDAWQENAGADPATAGERDLLDVIGLELSERHHGTRIGAVEPQHAAVDVEHNLCSLARVAYLDTSVIVAVLDGPQRSRLLETTGLAEACLEIARAEPDADAVAVTVTGGEWPTVVLEVPDLRRAYEPPGGAQKGPRSVREPLPIVDALAKHLDRHVTAWEAAEQVEKPLMGADVAALAARNAASAVAQLSREGQRATTPAKREAWTGLPVELGERIAEVVVALSRHESLDAAMRRLGPGDDE